MVFQIQKSCLLCSLIKFNDKCFKYINLFGDRKRPKLTINPDNVTFKNKTWKNGLTRYTVNTKCTNIKNYAW